MHHVSSDEPSLPEAEARRLSQLCRTSLLDTAPDPAFDRLVALVADVFDVPVAVVSLVDADRVWFKASVGLTVREGPRDGAFCNLAIGGEGLFEVPDAADDPRFAGSAMVCATPGIRFYAGAPIRDEQGQVLGTVLVFRDITERYSLGMTEQLLQAAIDAGHSDGGVEEIEGVPPQIEVTPGMPVRQAVARRQARVRSILHRIGVEPGKELAALRAG